MSRLPIVQMIQSYSKLELLKSAVTGLLFVLLYGGIFLTPLIMISMLYVPFMRYFLLLMYVAMALIGSYGFEQYVAALRHYNDVVNLPYDTFKQRGTIVFAIVVFITLSIVYLTYL